MARLLAHVHQADSAQNAAMIAGILLLVNPRTPHAHEMKEIVRLFKQEHPYDPKADDFTQKEATIVSTPRSDRTRIEAHWHGSQRWTNVG